MCHKQLYYSRSSTPVLLILSVLSKMSHQTENAPDQNVVRVDRTFAFVEKLRRIPCLGFAMAVASGVCFATASFTVELMRGDSGEGVDASIVVTGR